MLLVLFVSACALACWRLWQVSVALQHEDETPMLAFPFTVILPFVLIMALGCQRPTSSREGILMRTGAIIHLLLIIAFPGFALYLALGFPFVALTVELFETRAPVQLRDGVARALIIC